MNLELKLQILINYGSSNRQHNYEAYRKNILDGLTKTKRLNQQLHTCTCTCMYTREKKLFFNSRSQINPAPKILILDLNELFNPTCGSCLPNGSFLIGRLLKRTSCTVFPVPSRAVLSDKPMTGSPLSLGSKNLVSQCLTQYTDARFCWRVMPCLQKWRDRAEEPPGSVRAPPDSSCA